MGLIPTLHVDSWASPSYTGSKSGMFKILSGADFDTPHAKLSSGPILLSESSLYLMALKQTTNYAHEYKDKSRVANELTLPNSHQFLYFLPHKFKFLNKERVWTPLQHKKTKKLFFSS